MNSALLEMLYKNAFTRMKILVCDEPLTTHLKKEEIRNSSYYTRETAVAANHFHIPVQCL